MSDRPLTPCPHPGCATLVATAGYCVRHEKQRVARNNASRTKYQNPAVRYGGRWNIERKAYLRAHPMCACDECKGRNKLATVVDHITPHRGNANLFWNPTNWQPLAKQCHDRKTAREIGFAGMNRNPRERCDG